MKRFAEHRVSGVCPTFFQGCCYEASQGAQGGYLWAGHTLAMHVAGLLSYLDEEFDATLESLQTAIDDGDDQGVLAWFDRELPRCMALVPHWHRQQFLKGIYLYTEGGHKVREY
jgi:hypothetical protein